MTKVVKIMTRLGLMDRLQWRRASQGFEAMDREAVKLGQDLAPLDRGNGEERARLRLMDQRGRVMIWIGSYHIIHDCVGALVASTLGGWS